MGNLTPFLVDYAYGPYVGRMPVDALDKKAAVEQVLASLTETCGWLPSCVQSGTATPRNKE